MINILHVAVHTGGGVGTTIKNLVESMTDCAHVVACLNNEDPRSFGVAGSIHDMRNKTELLADLIADADVVILHWYNNPLLYEFLMTTHIPPCRLIVWGLANNLYAPYVMPEKLINMCDRFIVSTPASFQAQEYQGLAQEQKNKFGCIWAIANMKPFSIVKRTDHDTFNIGYAGTIDFNSKLHPDFVPMCKEINIPNASFIFTGSGPHIDDVKQQVKDAGLWDKFTFTGRVPDLSPWYAQMDVFGYPLYEKHYGTSEQVIGEAMAAGAVPVVLNNPPEYQIVTHNYNGIITDTRNYPREIERLYNNPGILNTLSKNARVRSRELYNTDIMTTQWRGEIERIMDIPKTQKTWYRDDMGSWLFIQSLGEYGRIFEVGNKNDIIDLFKSNRQWLSVSKGSILQYSQIYPNDVRLREWRDMLCEVSA